MKNQQMVLFLRKTLEKYRLRTHLVLPKDLCGESIDLGLRKQMGLWEEYPALLKTFSAATHNTIYRYTDRFFCSYFFFLLPESSELLIAGPYCAFPVTKKHLLEKAELSKIPPSLFAQLEHFYTQLPILEDSLPLLNLFTSFGEVLWGSSDAFSMDFADESVSPLGEIFLQDIPTETPLFDMQLMEDRYYFENQLMDIVSRGQLHRVELFTERLSSKMFETRVADPVRNLKNYCIICNTLLRKAAERGGVHPFYLDQTSSDYAARIEMIHSQNIGLQLLQDMVRSYCRLVRKHAGDSFSPLIRKAVLLIENDLSCDLSLNTVVKELAVSPSYLSSLFKKETGKTFTEFVTHQRMTYAKHLLETTKLQVQTVAQHCGISDVNYFSKCFKKHFGITPRTIRK